MPYIPPHIIEQAREMDLLTYLQNYEPSELVEHGGVCCTKTHNSLKISNGKWYWWSAGIGGRSALDYLIKVRDIPFMQAVEIIMGRTAIEPPVFVSREKPIKPKHLILPNVNRYATNVVNYLEKRGIDKDIIGFCIRTGRIYESYPYHNAVFVGFDKSGAPKYAALRGINSGFIGEAVGSDKRYSFEIPAGTPNDTVHLFESAVDLLSYATLRKLDGKEWHGADLLSLSGVYFPKNSGMSKPPAALERYLSDNPRIKRVVLNLDGDKAGRAATAAITAALSGNYEVKDKPPTVGKDFNDVLCIRLGLPITRNRERVEIAR